MFLSFYLSGIGIISGDMWLVACCENLSCVPFFFLGVNLELGKL